MSLCCTYVCLYLFCIIHLDACLGSVQKKVLSCFTNLSMNKRLVTNTKIDAVFFQGCVIHGVRYGGKAPPRVHYGEIGE